MELKKNMQGNKIQSHKKGQKITSKNNIAELRTIDKNSSTPDKQDIEIEKDLNEVMAPKKSELINLKITSKKGHPLGTN